MTLFLHAGLPLPSPTPTPAGDGGIWEGPGPTGAQSKCPRGQELGPGLPSVSSPGSQPGMATTCGAWSQSAGCTAAASASGASLLHPPRGQDEAGRAQALQPGGWATPVTSEDS